MRSRHNKRQRKKLHKFWLGAGVIDASQFSYWRAKLFASAEGEIFHINSDDTTRLFAETARAIRRYKLEYSVRVGKPEEAEDWLTEGGNVPFVFWATEFPSVRLYSGNNPDVI